MMIYNRQTSGNPTAIFLWMELVVKTVLLLPGWRNEIGQVVTSVSSLYRRLHID